MPEVGSVCGLQEVSGLSSLVTATQPGGPAWCRGLCTPGAGAVVRLADGVLGAARRRGILPCREVLEPPPSAGEQSPGQGCVPAAALTPGTVKDLDVANCLAAPLSWPWVWIRRLCARQTAANSSRSEQQSRSLAGRPAEATSSCWQLSQDLPAAAGGGGDPEKLRVSFRFSRLRVPLPTRVGSPAAGHRCRVGWREVHWGAETCPSVRAALAALAPARAARAPLQRRRSPRGSRAERLAPAGTSRVLLQHGLTGERRVAEPEPCL